MNGVPQLTDKYIQSCHTQFTEVYLFDLKRNRELGGVETCELYNIIGTVKPVM
jgi:hypothetical protein